MEQTTEVVYQFIRAYILERGYSPTIREISSACYVGRSGVFRYLNRLEQAGRIKRAPGVSRSISLTDSESKK